MKNFFLSILFIIVVLFSLSSCGKDQDNTDTTNMEPIMYTIDYIVNGGDHLEPEVMPIGTEINIAPEPLRTGYAFVGWFLDEDLTVAFMLPIILETDYTLYAAWQVLSYTITFDTKQGSTIAPLTKDYGTPIDAPEPPALPGHTFDGWFLDEDLTKSFLFDTMPAEHLTLYAKWLED